MSAKWTGTLTPDQTGLYRFSLAESGIATLKIAGQTFGPACREATQFITGPHYVLQGAVRLTAGDREDARRAYCAYEAGPAPRNGEILGRSASGSASLALSNRGPQSAVVTPSARAGTRVTSASARGRAVAGHGVSAVTT